MFSTVNFLIQLFECRAKLIQGSEEKERFATLSLDYMSEEYSADGGETLFVHQPPWRSNGKAFPFILLCTYNLLYYRIAGYFRRTNFRRKAQLLGGKNFACFYFRPTRSWTKIYV